MGSSCKTCERTNGTHSRRCMMMHKCHRYPTLKEVNDASDEQLCRWHRFLPPNGDSGIGSAQFEEILKREKKIMNLIHTRIANGSLLTDKMSKKIGW
jgi:hypothetical protein